MSAFWLPGFTAESVATCPQEPTAWMRGYVAEVAATRPPELGAGRAAVMSDDDGCDRCGVWVAALDAVLVASEIGDVIVIVGLCPACGQLEVP